MVPVLVRLVHFLIVLAYRCLVVPLSYLQIVAGLVLGYLVFGDLPDTIAWFGIATVVASGLVLVGRAR